MDRPDPIPLAFDDVVIDFAGRRLLRGGRPQALEPKAFDVLALLAQAPGRVFTRDEILDAVWGHRYVTPGVLNRVVTLLRHALGEDAHAPHYLHTLHGVGYRFDPGARAAPPRPPGAPGAPWRRLGWLLLPLLALMLAAAWYLRPRAEPVAAMPVSSAARPAPMPVLVVMPLKPIGLGEGVRILADGLSEEMIGSLARIDGLRVIARESTRLAAAETRDPAQLAQRLDATHSLEGSLQQDGQSLRIRLRLVDAGSGSALWTRDFDRHANEVLPLQREIAEAVAAALTLKLGLAGAPRESGDAEFLRRSLAARRLLASGSFWLPLEDAERAESEFRALLREREEDAHSHAGLAMALTIREIRTPALASALRAEVLHEAGIARRLDPSLPEPYVLLARDACARDAWERCLALQAEAARVAPSDVRTVVGYQFILARLGYLDRAEAAARELAVRDPINTSPRFILGRLLDTRGRHDEARAELEKAGAGGAYARWFNAVWRRDHAQALRIATTQIGAPDNDDPNAALLVPGYVAVSHALIDPQRWPQALAEFDTYERNAVFWNFSRVLAPDAPAHAPEFIARLNEMRRRNYSSWDLLLWTKDLAWLRRDPAFQDYLRDTGILAYWRRHGFPQQCRPVGEGAACA